MADTDTRALEAELRCGEYLARALAAESKVERLAEALAKAHQKLPGIEVPAMNGDNLAVTLCAAFDDGGEEIDDYGWSQAAIDGYNQTYDAIRNHYDAAFARALAEVKPQPRSALRGTDE